MFDLCREQTDNFITLFVIENSIAQLAIEHQSEFAKKKMKKFRLLRATK